MQSDRNSVLMPLRVSYEYTRQLAHTIDQYQRERARTNRAVANRKRKMRGAGVLTTRPLERVEIDNFYLDVHLVCGRTGVHLGRPWLTLAIDHFSGVVVGYHLTFAPPSAASLLAALRHAIYPKAPADETPLPVAAATTVSASTESGERGSAAWPCFGIPDSIAVDNGSDMTSHGFMDAAQALGIEVIFCPPRAPWYKGTVERAGGSLNVRLLHWLPGSTLGRPKEVGAPDPKEDACLQFQQLNGYLARYFPEIHNHTPRRSRPGTPLARWLAGIQRFPVRLSSDKDELDAAVSLRAKATLRQTGIEYESRFYANEELEILWNTCAPGTKVDLRVNPLDVREILVRHPRTGLFLRVPSTKCEDWPIPLAYHRMLVEQMRASGRDPADAAALAVSEKNLREDIAQDVRAARRKMARIANESYRDQEPAPPAPAPAFDPASARARTGAGFLERIRAAQAARPAGAGTQHDADPDGPGA